MKAFCIFSLFTLVALAQSESTQTQAVRYDLNGNAINAGSFSESKVKMADGGEQTRRVEYSVDVNGRKVPLTSVEETRHEVNGQIVSTKIIHEYDQNGVPTSSERIVSEEQISGTQSNKKTSVYRTDVNGNEMLDQKTVSEFNGGSGTTEILKRGSDGSLTLAEKQTTVAEELPGGGSKSQVVTYRKDNNGDLYVAVQEVKETVKTGNEVKEVSAQYVRGGQGALELAQQTVTHEVKQADGTVSKQVDVYAAAVPGLTNTGGAPVLKERQTVEMRKGPNGALIETTVSQKATVDGGQLGSPRVISEAVISSTKTP